MKTKLYGLLCGAGFMVLACAPVPPIDGPRQGVPGRASGGAVGSESAPLTRAEARERATAVLLDGSRSESALLRMHAIEGAKALPDRALPLVQLGIEDANPAVRFAAWVTTARLELASLGSRAERVAGDVEQPDYVRNAALLAAHRAGRDVDLAPLAEMLWHPDPRQRANAALLLGLSEEPSSIPVLRDAAQDPLLRSEPIDRDLVRLQINEALLKLGDEPSLKPMRTAAYSSHDEVRILATLMIGRVEDRSMQGNLVTFLAKDPVELRLAAAESLARMGSAEGLPVMLDAVSWDVPTVRTQAAFALGQLYGRPQAAATLAGLLDDPDPRVRLAAASAVLDATR